MMRTIRCRVGIPMRTKKLKLSRFIIFFIFVFVAFLTLCGRFFQIQVLEGKEYADEFNSQCWRMVNVSAQRGTIYDRNGVELAYSSESENIFVKTDSLSQIEKIVEKTAPLLHLSKHDLYKKLVSNMGRRTSLAKNVNPIVSDKIRDMKLKGLIFENIYDRIYPFKHCAAALVGFLDHNYEAKAGVELYCNEQLTGRDGMQSCIKDGSGNLYPIYSQPEIPPVDGNDIYLTIDIEYQQILQEEIDSAVSKWKAQSGTGVLMEIETGKVLAIYHCDTSFHDPEYRIPQMEAITKLYEPGSTFKTIAFAALIEEGLLDLDDTIYAGEGIFYFNGVPLRDDKKLNIITEAEAFILSSNIATGRLANRLGPKKLYRYTRDFGFGLSTGLNFPSEKPGRFRTPPVWSEYYCAMLSIGHEVSTSVLQMARVFGCIGGQGLLMKPILVDRVVSPTGGTIEKNHPEVVRRIFSDSTIAVMKDLCAWVVDTGTAKYALTDGITFSGKTGTAEKLDPENGGYDKSRYIGSFGGYFPRENPKICGIIILDEPHKVHYGGITAGPAFARAAKRITDLENRRRAALQEGLYALDSVIKSEEAPSVKAKFASATANQIEFEKSIQPEKSLDINKSPDSSSIYLPELRGKSVRTAARILHSMGLECTLEGDGSVVASVPASGSFARPGEKVKLICARNPKEAAY